MDNSQLSPWDFWTIFFAVFAYLVVIHGILFKNKTNSFATWFLWFLIDSVAYYAAHRSHESKVLVTIFVLGTISVSVALLVKKKFSWGKTEWFTSVVFAACLAFSFLSRNTDQIVWVSSIAIFVAGIPFFKLLWDKERIDLYTKIYSQLFFASIICTTVSAWFAHQSLVLPVWCLAYWAIAYVIIFFIKESDGLEIPSY
ncbi:MAG: hypothetical protein JWM20_768 [Patescibacteria group bacterium]|nr:hypothetical protein [Patescibacteria group bacterium]